MTSSDPRIRCDISGHLVTITIDRPAKLNALDRSMLDALGEAAQELDRDERVRVVILTGASERAFCVGADIEAWAGLDSMTMWKRWVRDGHRVMNAISGMRQPVIAAVNGYALGGGLELALAADLRICSDNAEFGAPEVRVGTVAGWGATSRLPEVIGRARAAHMMLTGNRVSAGIAEGWGLVTDVMTQQDLKPSAIALAEQIASASPAAVQMTKQMLSTGEHRELSVVLESLAGGLAKSTSDADEGLAAFREKRDPNFGNGSPTEG